MENPATWGPAEHAIRRALDEDRQMRLSPEPVVGLSLVRRIADALREEGLLKESPANISLPREQARYLSILVAADLRTDYARGADTTPMRDIHAPAWEALQPACEWDAEDG